MTADGSAQTPGPRLGDAADRRSALSDADRSAPAGPRAAATVVVMRHGRDRPEVLLTRRPASMAFGPGLHVFPGGAVDPADADPALIDRLRSGDALPPRHAAPFAVAAIRELFEEAGVLLASDRDGAPADAVAFARAAAGGSFAAAVIAGDLSLRADWLVPLSRWVTPPVVPRRFDARFFVAWLPDGATPVFDPVEVADHVWLTPDAALTEMAAGRIELWTPTSTTLQQLSRAVDLADIRRHLAPLVREPSISPDAADRGGPLVDHPLPLVTRIRFVEAGAIAGQTVDSYLVGRRQLAVVDPGDPSDAAIDTILSLVDAMGARLHAVLLTAPVPDHAAGAESLALRLRIPVVAGPGARHVLASEVEPAGDGALLAAADTAVRVIATPGPHPDHLAYELPEAGAVLVGDLEGPGPARAIPGPVDQTAAAGSRARIESLGPRRILAAHR